MVAPYIGPKNTKDTAPQTRLGQADMQCCSVAVLHSHVCKLRHFVSACFVSILDVNRKINQKKRTMAVVRAKMCIFVSWLIR